GHARERHAGERERVHGRAQLDAHARNAVHLPFAKTPAFGAADDIGGVIAGAGAGARGRARAATEIATAAAATAVTAAVIAAAAGKGAGRDQGQHGRGRARDHQAAHHLLAPFACARLASATRYSVPISTHAVTGLGLG